MRLKNIRKALKSLDGYEVAAGWSESARYANGERVGDVALYNEFGTSSIPARPFVRAALNASQDKIKRAVSYAVEKILEGSDAETALAWVGEAIINEIDNQIVSGGFQKNAPSTIAAKGFNKPLVDTGLMRQSLTFLVQKGKR